MCDESFARVEIKYLLTVQQASAIEDALRHEQFTRMDFGDPTVQSLYYDTPDHLLIRSSLERPSYKEKLRLRAYGKPERVSLSFIEIKKKYQGVVYKRRISMPLEEARHCLRNEHPAPSNSQVAREAQWMVGRYSLQPAAVIRYDRDAWFSEAEPDVRITFDRDLSFRQTDLSLSGSTPNLPLSAPDQRLMEIKTGGVYPLWLSRLLWEVDARRFHFSKYGFAYLNYINPANTRNAEMRIC